MTGEGRADVTHHRLRSLKDIFEGEALHDSAERCEISTTFGIPLALAGRCMCTLTLHFDNQRGWREVKVNSGSSLGSPVTHHLTLRAWQPIEPTQPQELPLKFVCTPGIQRGRCPRERRRLGRWYVARSTVGAERPQRFRRPGSPRRQHSPTCTSSHIQPGR